MQIALHLGAHGTDNNKINQCLSANATRLEITGTQVPPQGDYRKPLMDVLSAKMKSETVKTSDQENLLKKLGIRSGADRVVLSHENILGRPHRIFERAHLYPAAPNRLSDLFNLLPVNELQVFMAIRNPVPFIAETFRLSGSESFSEFVDGVRLGDVRWSEMIERMVNAVPQADFTIWCYEDAPVLWPDLLRMIAGQAADMPLDGDLEFLEDIMTEEGMTRMRAYIEQKNPNTPALRQRIIMAFLDKFAIEEKLEQELDLPGLTQDIVDRVTLDYEKDLARIAALPGVKLLVP